MAIGNLNDLPKKAHAELLDVIEKTKDNTHMTLTLALSYGSREEIVSVIKELTNKVKNNIISVENIDESIINKHLYTQNLPDVDLLIRTSGEQRISNFLLWQIAHSEILILSKYWPEMTEKSIKEAFVNYQMRNRRHGK